MPSSITVSYNPTHASNRFRLNHSHPALFVVAAQDFVMKCIEARAVRWPVVWKFYGSLTLGLLHFPTGGANDAQNVSVDSSKKR